MADHFDALEPDHISFIEAQHLFFIGTAGAEGRVNVSPKGMDSLRVLDAGRVAWLNLTGSGNETAAHVLENKRMTIMFCSLEKQPLILRLYGSARAIHERDEDWGEYTALFPQYTGARQVFVMDVELVQTSCGFAVPFYEFKGERPTLRKWAENKGRDGVREYWRDRNTASLDDRETGIFGDQS